MYQLNTGDRTAAGAPLSINLRGMQQRWERFKLRYRLGELADSARSHQDAGIPAGDPRLAKLRDNAREMVGEYGERWSVPVDSLEAELPVISQLEAHAIPKQSNTLFLVGMYFGVPVLIGLAAGLGWIAFHLVTSPFR